VKAAPGQKATHYYTRFSSLRNNKKKRTIKISSTDPPTHHKSLQEAEAHGPFDEYKNCKTTETTPVAYNPTLNLRHIFKKTGTRQKVTGTRGELHDNQQQQEYRVTRKGAGNTAIQ
jgi:hypothetical protein